MQETSTKTLCTDYSPTVHLSCGRHCDPARVKAQGRRKYVFTDQLDQLIREVYSSRGARKRVPASRYWRRKSVCRIGH